MHILALRKITNTQAKALAHLTSTVADVSNSAPPAAVVLANQGYRDVEVVARNGVKYIVRIKNNTDLLGSRIYYDILTNRARLIEVKYGKLIKGISFKDLRLRHIFGETYRGNDKYEGKTHNVLVKMFNELLLASIRNFLEGWITANAETGMHLLR